MNNVAKFASGKDKAGRVDAISVETGKTLWSYETRVANLRRGVDATREVDASDLSGSTLEITADPRVLKGSSFFVVAVPTPIDGEHRPDLGPVLRASETVGAALSAGRARGRCGGKGPLPWPGRAGAHSWSTLSISAVLSISSVTSASPTFCRS